MKLTDDEKRLMVAALSYAIASTAGPRRAWEFSNLRKKIETALRQADSGSESE